MTLAIPPEYCGVAMAATRELIRRAKPATCTSSPCPQSGLQADMLIGAGLVATVEAAAVTMGERGPAPRFVAAVRIRRRHHDGRHLPRHPRRPAGFREGPALPPPARYSGHRHVLANRPDWRVIDNPFGSDDPIIALPAIRPDIALFHCEMADAHGNLWIGRRRELATMAHASAATVATVEQIHDGDFFADETLAAGALPAAYIDAIAHVPHGTWPLAMPGFHDADAGALDAYCAAATTPDGFAAWLAKHLSGTGAA